MSFRKDFFNNNAFDNFSNNFGDNFDNLRNIRRQRSPIFGERGPFGSQVPMDNFSPFLNHDANFGFSNPQPTQLESSKVYHVPIHFEKDDIVQSNSSVETDEKQHQTEQPTHLSTNYEKQIQNQPGQNKNVNFLPSDSSISKDRDQKDLECQQEELKKNFENSQYHQLNQGECPTGEYRIPIHFEDNLNESNKSNLVRDFNKINTPSAFYTSSPGQKNSTPNNFKEFNHVPSSFEQQHPIMNLQSSVQQPQSVQEEQEPPKKIDPMTIIQNILDEAEKYEHEIENFTGEFQDKQYRYLDEYLTRCMLRLDTIDTNGDTNLKQARKNAIHYINKIIAKLEQLEYKKNSTNMTKDDVRQEQNDKTKNEEFISKDEKINEKEEKSNEKEEKSNEKEEKLNEKNEELSKKDEESNKKDEKSNVEDNLNEEINKDTELKEKNNLGEKTEKSEDKNNEKKKTIKKSEIKEKKKIKKSNS